MIARVRSTLSKLWRCSQPLAHAARVWRALVSHCQHDRPPGRPQRLERRNGLGRIIVRAPGPLLSDDRAEPRLGFVSGLRRPCTSPTPPLEGETSRTFRTTASSRKHASHPPRWRTRLGEGSRHLQPVGMQLARVSAPRRQIRSTRPSFGLGATVLIQARRSLAFGRSAKTSAPGDIASRPARLLVVGGGVWALLSGIAGLWRSCAASGIHVYALLLCARCGAPSTRAAWGNDRLRLRSVPVRSGSGVAGEKTFRAGSHRAGLLLPSRVWFDVKYYMEQT